MGSFDSFPCLHYFFVYVDHFLENLYLKYKITIYTKSLRKKSLLKVSPKGVCLRNANYIYYNVFTDG